MKKYAFWLVVVMFFPFTLPAQSGNWVEDSLSFYQSKLRAALGKQDLEELLNYYNKLATEGAKTLDIQIFEILYSATKDDFINEHPKLLGKIYHQIGNLEFYRSRNEASQNAFVNAMEQYKLAGLNKDVAGMAMNLGVLLERASEYDSAILSYEKALPIFKEMKDTSSIATCLENIGLAFSYKGDFKTALLFYEQTDSVLKTNTPDNASRWTTLWYNKSNIYSSMGEFEKALEYALKGLRLSEENEDERSINMGYIMLEDVYENLNDSENWLKYMRMAEVFAKKTENGLRLSQLYYSLGHYYLNANNPDSALHYAEKGLNYYTENNYAEGLSKGYTLKGKINFHKEDYRKAIKSYEMAIDNLSNSESKELASMYHGIGTSYMKLYAFEEATTYLQRALDLRLKMGDLGSIRESYEVLSECSKEQGDYMGAYNHMVKFNQYDDSVFNEIKSKQIAEIQTQYETEKKDQAIAGLEQEQEIQRLKNERQSSQIYLSLAGLALLFILVFVFYNRARLKQKANKMLEAKNNEIAQQNKEKEVLLKEIHHRVKNNLQVISSLLNMQTRALSDTKVIDAMKESQSRVKTMALIHEKLYQYDDLSRVNMKEYMNQLSEFLSQTYHTEKSINMVIEVEDINLDIDTAVPLGLITNELLSNALKYAFQDMDQGEIKIVLSQQESDGYRLMVSDSGKGFPKDLDIKNSTSLGLRLVHTLTRQINGDLSIDSENGATFSIAFKEENVLVA